MTVCVADVDVYGGCGCVRMTAAAVDVGVWRLWLWMCVAAVEVDMWRLWLPRYHVNGLPYAPLQVKCSAVHGVGGANTATQGATSALNSLRR